MRVAIDTQALFSPLYKGRGIANYVLNQLRTLFTMDSENEYILFNIYSDEMLTQTSLAGFANVSEFQLFTGQDTFVINDMEPDGKTYKFTCITERIVRRFLQENKIEVFYLASPFDHWDIYQPEWFEGIKTIATVYDVVPHLFKKDYLLNSASELAYYRKMDLIRSFDKITAISQSAKDDLVNELGFGEEQVDVVYAGIDACFEEKEYTQSQQQTIKAKFGITGAFIFCAGGGDPRKNMPEMVEAYAMLPKELRQRYQLVVVCKLDARFIGLLETAAQKHSLEPGRMVITNFVTQDELVQLYTMASFTAFTSKYEGFGLPVIESMACGTPVVTSSNSSLGEIAEGAAILVDPFSIDSIRQGFLEALQGGLERFSENMGEKVKRFTWKHSAGLFLSSLNSLKSLQKGNIECKPSGIAVFTTLFPEETKEHKENAALIDALAETLPVSVYVEEPNKIKRKFSANVQVKHHICYPQEYSQHPLTLYCVEDNQYSRYMVKYLQQFKGAILLKSAALPSLYTAIQCAQNRGEDTEVYLGIGEDTISFIAAYASNILVTEEATQIALLEHNTALVSDVAYFGEGIKDSLAALSRRRLPGIPEHTVKQLAEVALRYSVLPEKETFAKLVKTLAYAL